MKKPLIYMLFSLSVITFNARSQNFLDSTAQWKQYDSYDGTASGSGVYVDCSRTKFIDGDTVFNTKTYFKVYQNSYCNRTEPTQDSLGNILPYQYDTSYTTSSNHVFVCYLREESNKYYGCKTQSFTNEELFYDFNLSVGQVVNSKVIDNGCYMGDSIVVDSVGQVYIGTQLRNIFWLSGAQYPGANYIIQGVGPSSGFLNWVCADGGPDDLSYDLSQFIIRNDTISPWSMQIFTSVIIPHTEYEIVNIFPNPSVGIFKLQMDSFEKAQIKIYNIYGNSIYQNIVTSSNFQIDLSSQPSGAYFVQIITGQGIVNKKLIIQK